jgi:hypothetical protein
MPVLISFLKSLAIRHTILYKETRKSGGFLIFQWESDHSQSHMSSSFFARDVVTVLT